MEKVYYPGMAIGNVLKEAGSLIQAREQK